MTSTKWWTIWSRNTWSHLLTKKRTWIKRLTFDYFSFRHTRMGWLSARANPIFLTDITTHLVKSLLLSDGPVESSVNSYFNFVYHHPSVGQSRCLQRLKPSENQSVYPVLASQLFSLQPAFFCLSLHCNSEVTGCGAQFSTCTLKGMGIEARVSSFY